MKHLKITGIVIAENNMGDFDKMLTILTPNLGKIGCSARGARRPKSLLLSGTQFLCIWYLKVERIIVLTLLIL